MLPVIPKLAFYIKQNRTLIVLTIFSASFTCGSTAFDIDYYSEPELIDYVNPFIGTGGHGHTFPGPTAPFGMVQLSPDTRLEGWDGCSGYHYSDSIIYGFSHTHLSGTGVSDYGDVLIMPITGDDFRDYASPFGKSYETAGAGYYTVFLNKPKVFAELTATYRTGVHRYTYQETQHAGFIIDLDHRDQLLDWELNLVNDTTIEGFRISRAWAQEQHIYFVIRSNQKISLKNDAQTLKHFVLEEKNKKLVLQVGISAVDIEGARNNLDTEHNGWNFEEYVSNLRKIWNAQLSKITVEGAPLEYYEKFYTALYHTMIAPNLFSDVDGRYRGTDLKIHQTDPNSPQYTVFSLWDTFRTAHPLYTIIEPERTRHFIESMYRNYRDGGKLPMWELAANYTGCMIGFHALSVIADAYSKELISPHKIQLYKDAMIEMFEKDNLGTPEFLKHGYIPGDKEPESVSKTLEYAYNSWCLANTFPEDPSLWEDFMKLSGTYRNLFDPATNFMTPRMNGSFIKTFDPYEVNFHFTEANAWQYNFFVPHDMNGLISLHGGYDSFENHLDALFTANQSLNGRQQPDITGLIGQYSQGNEPDHHVPFLYYYLGKPHKSQKLVDGILDSLYTNEPDGLSGNEDCGQMSAWFVMASIGLYPALPGSNEFFVLKPEFNRVVISDENNPRFTLTRHGDGNYVSTVLSNDSIPIQPVIRYSKRAEHQHLLVKTSDSIQNFNKISNIGYTNRDRLIVNPTYKYSTTTFRKKMRVELAHAEMDSVVIYYTKNGSKPTINSKEYKRPVKIKKSTTFQSIACYKGTDHCSFIEEAHFERNDSRISIKLDSEYSNQYPADGPNSLVDGKLGGSDFRTGGWQGFYDTDFIATLDLGKKRKISAVEIRYLEDIKSWIWSPERIILEYSTDGKTFTPIDTIFVTDTTAYGESAIISSVFRDIHTKANYLRIKATNRGPNPSWHLGAGDATWLFFDEITVE